MGTGMLGCERAYHPARDVAFSQDGNTLKWQYPREVMIEKEGYNGGGDVGMRASLPPAGNLLILS